MRVVIHPGFPKSATTFLQSAFEAGVPGISYLGKFYSVANPKEEASRWANDLLFEAVQWCRSNAGEPYPAPESLDVTIQEIEKRAFNGVMPKVHVLSDERLSKPGTTADWRQSLALRFHQLFPDAHILLTIRNQKPVLNSLFGMYLRHHAHQPQTNAVIDFSDWLKADGFGRTSFSDRLDYGAFYDAFEDVFGSDRIHVIPYEYLQTDSKLFVQALATVLGIPEFDLTMSTTVNPRPSKHELKHLATACRLPPRLRLHSLTKLLAPLLLHRLSLEMGEDECRYVDDQFGESNRSLAERTGLDLAVLGYPLAST